MRTLVTVTIACLAVVLLYTNIIKPLTAVIEHRVNTINTVLDSAR